MTQVNRYIILGSGIAGMAAAEAIRERDEDGSILMISAEQELCFNRPMLIREFALDGSGAALFEKQQSWPEQFQVNVRLNTRIVAIDTAKKQIRIESVAAPETPAKEEAELSAVPEATGSPIQKEAGQVAGETISYDRLIYALGAEVTIPPIPGADRGNVHVVRTREDMRKIRAAMRTAAHAVVIGGGMLGLEDAWALREEKLEVAIIEQKQRVAFGQIDQSAGNLMKKRIERMGVPVYVNAAVTEIGDGYVTFRSEEELVTIPADLVILSTGVTPNSALGAKAGLATSGSAGTECSCCSAGGDCGLAQPAPQWIAADEYCRTSDPDIFAAGDCAAVNGRNDAIWEEARQMGRVAGTNAVLSLPDRERTSDESPHTADSDWAVYHPVVAEHVFVGFDTEVFTMADSSGAGTDGVYIRHADVEIFDYQRERYIRVSLQDGIIVGILLINAPELAPELMEAYHAGAGEEEARQIVLRWKDSHEVDFKPAAQFRHR